MNNRTRNRLIGLIAILILIMLLFPYIIRENAFQPAKTISLTPPSDHEPTDLTDTHPTITAAPDVDDPSPQIVTAPDQVTEPSLPTAPVNSPNLPSIDSETRPLSDKVYSIQLVALKNRQKIEELVALLRLHNYEVYIEPQRAVANQLTRLYVGPYSSREQAELVILDLKNLTKLQGFLVAR